ncbi:hypothetical protein LENED_009564 [Lentinula edodes]|uniref:Uncharacterized protein n=1 Tax=Lentinula edodes TaxID=5353 RepID=A0A1Q3EK36_LENED|nr:hypothetical protein LENED_009564 [Lentinula edodes]
MCRAEVQSIRYLVSQFSMDIEVFRTSLSRKSSVHVAFRLNLARTRIGFNMYIQPLAKEKVTLVKVLHMSMSFTQASREDRTVSSPREPDSQSTCIIILLFLRSMDWSPMTHLTPGLNFQALDSGEVNLVYNTMGLQHELCK